MLPFTLDLKPGEPVQPQVVHAVRRAVLSGDLAGGERFPSVRRLSQELKINPNTAHKVIATLVQEGILEVRPGIGTVVTGKTGGDDSDRAALLDRELERLVVEARRLGVERSDLDTAIDRHWDQLNRPNRKNDPSGPTPRKDPS